MKEHKYEKLLEQAERLSDETGCSALVLVDDGEDVGCFVRSRKGGLAVLLNSLMEQHRPVAEIIVGVTGEYVKRRMVASVKGKDAMKQAYEETKKVS